MPWAKFDDQFPDHPKVITAGPAAAWLFVCGVCYCARMLTNGFIPRGQVRKLADVDDSVGLANRLVDVGLWEEVPGGYQIHDYLEYNPPAERVKEEREKTKQRVSEWRRRNATSNGVTTVEQTECNGVSTVPPVPVPVPESRTSPPVPAGGSTTPPPTGGVPETRKKTRVPAPAGEPCEDGRPAAKTTPTWEAYSSAYEERYGVLPIRDRHANAFLSRFIDSVGAQDAPDIARFYVWMNKDWYVKKLHDLKYLANDAQGVRTQWKRGRTVTSREAGEADRLQGQGNVWREVAESYKGQTG